MADEIEQLRTYRAGIPRTAAGAQVRRDTDARIRAAQGLPKIQHYRKVRRGGRAG